MLARAQRLQRPFDVQVVGQGDVDRIYPRIGQKRVIAGMQAQRRAEGAKPFGLGRV